MVKVLSSLSIDTKVLIVTGDDDETVGLSARNLPNVTFLTAGSLNVLDVVKHDKLVITQDAVKKVEEVFA